MGRGLGRFFLILIANVFREKSSCPKNKCFEFFLLVHTSRLKHFTFFRKFLLHKRKSSKFANSRGSEGYMIYCLYSQFFTVNLLGTKSFSLLSNFLIFSVHSTLIQTTDFNIFHPSLPSDRNFWSRRMTIRMQFFRKANV